MPLFKTIGEPVTLPVVIGYQNLPMSHLSHFVEDLEWQDYDFTSPKSEVFWGFSGCLYSLEKDCSLISRISILFGSDWELTTSLGVIQYALKFTRNSHGHLAQVTLQQIEPADLVLPDELTDKQAEEVVNLLSDHRGVAGLTLTPRLFLACLIHRLIGYSSKRGRFSFCRRRSTVNS